jgi:hypothetical protein
MRILLSCLQSLKRHRIPAHDFWRVYFTKGCEESGIEFVEIPGVDWAEGLTYPPSEELAAWLARTWERVLGFVRREQAVRPFDFFLGYLYPSQVEPAAIREIQRLDIPCVNFFCDNVREFRKVPAAYNVFDLHWVPEWQALEMYRKAGLKYVHAAMPCWVPHEMRTPPSRESEPPTFIGSADVLRRDLLGRAQAAGGDFVVRGPGWDSHEDPLHIVSVPARSFLQLVRNQVIHAYRHGPTALFLKMANRLRPLRFPEVPADNIYPPVFGTEYLRVTREAEITIGVNRVPTPRHSLRLPVSYSRLRDIEAPMLGACYLTEWAEDLEHLYDLGTEIETYRTAEELVEKTRQLKADPKRRFMIRQSGQRRALAQHTIGQSINQITEMLGFKR